MSWNDEQAKGERVLREWDQERELRILRAGIERLTRERDEARADKAHALARLADRHQEALRMLDAAEDEVERLRAGLWKLIAKWEHECAEGGSGEYGMGRDDGMGTCADDARALLSKPNSGTRSTGCS